MNNSSVILTDTKIAFASKSDSDLNRAYWLFKLISYNWLVQIGPALVHTAIKLRIPINGLIKPTIFKHFCGGEDIASCEKTIGKLNEFGIGTILDYSVEGKEQESDFDQTLEETIETINRAKGSKAIPFCVFKPSGIARTELLQKHTNGESFNLQQQAEFDRYLKRFDRICSTAFENKVRVFIDAEDFCIQGSIDNIALSMMRKYNKLQPIVFNTLQMYRHDRLAYLKELLQLAAQDGYFLGLKLVRGAYMEKERLRAEKLGYPSPIQPDKSATDRDYNEALKTCIENIGRVAICAGTHNENSSLLLVDLMNEKGIAHDHPHVWFSQLYGMSDHISFNLAQAGYNVCKYVPYGPVKAVLPYLIRRAQENTSVAGQTGRELSLILTEKKRRKN